MNNYKNKNKKKKNFYFRKFIIYFDISFANFL